MFCSSRHEPAFIKGHTVNRQMPDQLVAQFIAQGGQFIDPMPGPANRQMRRIWPGINDKARFVQCTMTFTVQLSEPVLRIQTEPDDPGTSQAGKGSQPDYIDLEGPMTVFNG